MEFHVVIPARFGSTRLPGKPLIPIKGVPMVLRVMRQAQLSGATSVTVATDDQRITDVVTAAGGTVLLTAANHPSGTDRLVEVVESMQWPKDTIVVNVQGDEPGIPPAIVHQTAQLLHDYPDAAVSTLTAAIRHSDDLTNPNLVKVVVDKNGYALYFSRAPIAWVRDSFQHGNFTPLSNLPHLRHIGIYGYRVSTLLQHKNTTPVPLELAESLEQLRFLYNGQRIITAIASETPPPGIDTTEDIAIAESFLQ